MSAQKMLQVFCFNTEQKQKCCYFCLFACLNLLIGTKHKVQLVLMGISQSYGDANILT